MESIICPSAELFSLALIRRLRRGDRDRTILNVSLFSTMLSLYTGMLDDLVISPGLNVTLISLELKSEVSKVQSDEYAVIIGYTHYLQTLVTVLME